MKKIISLAVIFIALIFISGCSLYGSTPASPANPANTPAPGQTGTPNSQANTISIKNFAFNPAELTIKSGQTVTWVNDDSAPHQIKSTTFNSAALSTGQSYSFTFNQAGTFDYSCAIHPSMTGKIIVQ